MPDGQQICYLPVECCSFTELSQAAGYAGHMRSQLHQIVESSEVLCHHSCYCFLLLPIGSPENWSHRLSRHSRLSQHWPGVYFLGWPRHSLCARDAQRWHSSLTCWSCSSLCQNCVRIMPGICPWWMQTFLSSPPRRFMYLGVRLLFLFQTSIRKCWLLLFTAVELLPHSSRDSSLSQLCCQYKIP